MLRSFLHSQRVIVMYLTIVFLCFPEIPNAQQKTTNQVSHPKLYLCITNDLNSNLKTYFKSKHVKTLKLITSLNFDPNNQLKIDESLFAKKIEELYPNPNATGIGIIDWEGKAYEQLKSFPANDARFKKLEQLYIKLIQLAKHTRPKMKWGFFGLPFKQYREKDKNWQKNGLKLANLLKNCDVILPSLYDFYQDTLKGKSNKQYITDNVLLALKLGNNTHKPVYPFVWHQWHNSKKGLQLIPIEDFYSHVKTTLNVRYKGKGVAGVIWWAEDRYNYNTRFKVNTSDQSINRYHDTMIMNYLKRIKVLF